MTAPDPFRLSRVAAPVTVSDAPLQVPDAGRSTLLRAGLRTPGRKRSYLRRALVMAILLGAVGLLVLAVARVWFRPDGPAVLLYLVHDTIWLPLRGRLWVAPFPGGLVWLVPLLGLSALALVEFLGVASPLRRVQVAGIGLALRGRPAAALVLWDAALRRFGGRAGQVRSVATELRDAFQAALKEIIASQRRVAEAAGCAFYNQLEAMGGEGTVAGWAAEDPPRAQKDRVHLTREGYAQLGSSFASDMMRAYTGWRRELGLPPTTPRPAEPAPLAPTLPAPVLEASE